MQALLLALIKGYQLLLSPWLGNQCRFYPTCSHYADEAIRRHGSLRGSALALRRLGRCHPWHAGGFDPVPDRPEHNEQAREERPAHKDADHS